MDRRSFLKGLSAAIMAPAVVRSSILMPVKEIIVPDGVALKSMVHPIVNGGTGLTEIARITREAFMPKLYTQIYQESPVWKSLIANGKAQ
jgi:hypothetical protein